MSIFTKAHRYAVAIEQGLNNLPDVLPDDWILCIALPSEQFKELADDFYRFSYALESDMQPVEIRIGKVCFTPQSKVGGSKTHAVDSKQYFYRGT